MLTPGPGRPQVPRNESGVTFRQVWRGHRRCPLEALSSGTGIPPFAPGPPRPARHLPSGSFRGDTDGHDDCGPLGRNQPLRRPRRAGALGRLRGAAGRAAGGPRARARRIAPQLVSPRAPADRPAASGRRGPGRLRSDGSGRPGHGCAGPRRAAGPLPAGGHRGARGVGGQLDGRDDRDPAGGGRSGDDQRARPHGPLPAAAVRRPPRSAGPVHVPALRRAGGGGTAARALTGHHHGPAAGAAAAHPGVRRPVRGASGPGRRLGRTGGAARRETGAGHRLL
ncbi:hypothetical protein M2266_000755 [Streptomyces sp. SPB162]|nr:hypothetical protein [Streptomyces sp. SPB162]